MDPKYRVVTKDNFNQFLASLAKEYRVIVPYANNGDFLFEEFKKQPVYNDYRCVTTIRQFLTPSREHLSSYFNDSAVTSKPICIVGAKSCDLQSLKIHDYVFLNDPVDQGYAAARNKNIIISSDCTSFKEVCFCLNLDIPPYPQELFDLNISSVDSVYLVEIGSAKGKELITSYSTFFQNAREEYLEERNRCRQALKEKLSAHLSAQHLVPKGSLYNLIKKNYEHPLWQSEALRCVECGACIMNCPTCHCFLLFDTGKENDYRKGRVWDGCQYKNFSRVAGGANPLLTRFKRLRNRYIKKFEFFVDNLGLPACTGCGRCIDGCPAKIDLRNIFKTFFSAKQ
jgi:ferredoxin